MNYEHFRHGSAGAVGLAELKRAGLLNGNGVSFGFDQSLRHELRNTGDGSIALWGGSGCGKSAALFANNIIGGHIPASFVCFDPRGELAAMSPLALSLQGYEIYYINPTGMHGLPQHRFNPLDHLSLGSPSLIADTQKMALDFCPTPAGSRSNWAFDDARRWVTELSLYDAERNGCASLTGIFELIMAMQGDIDRWCDHLDTMMYSRFLTVQAFATEIMGLQQEGRESFTAPMGVLQNAFNAMRDPRLQETFSGSGSGSDFSMQWLTQSGRKMAVFIIWPIEYLQSQAPVIRASIGSAIQYKLRHPSPAPVSILIDECGQLGNFPSVRELYTFGRGAGLTNNICSWQEISQLKAAFGAKAGEIIGSAQIRVFKGVRTMESAEMVSRMCGSMTLDYDAKIEQSNARRLKQHAAQKILSGGGFFEAASDIRHYSEAETHRKKQPRKLLEPDEVLNLAPSKMVAFASGTVEGAILGHWLNHFERSDFAGQYLNNPYHGELVNVKTAWGSQKRRVIEERAPERLAHLPQYQSGYWRYVDGYRPKI